MFRPRDSPDQRLYRAELIVDPEPSEVRWIHDVFGNCVALVEVSRPATELRFETHILLEHTPQAAPDLQIDDAALTYPFAYDEDEAPDLAPAIRPHYPARRGRPLGAAVPARRRADRDRPPADDALLRDPRGLRLLAAAGAGAPSRRSSPCGGGAGPAATSRC